MHRSGLQLGTRLLYAGPERLEALLRSKALFKQHTQSNAALRAVMHKIVVVEGDVHEKDCSLGAADLARLRTEVEVVIHSAASISFFEHIHVLLQQNYQVWLLVTMQRSMQLQSCFMGNLGQLSTSASGDDC